MFYNDKLSDVFDISYQVVEQLIENTNNYKTM